MIEQLERPTDLLGLLGRGSIGDTWVARLPDGTEVASKHVRCVDGVERDQLVRRVKALMTANVGEDVVPIKDVRTEGNDVWVDSELDDGLPLRRLLRVAALTPAQTVYVGWRILNALARLHEGGVCHGSVHDSNVHVAPDGRVRLSDAGLAPRGKRRSKAGEARCMNADVAGAADTIRSALSAEQQRRGNGATSAGETRHLVAAILPDTSGINASATPSAHEHSHIVPARAALERFLTAATVSASAENRAAAQEQLGAMVRSIKRPRQRLGKVEPVTVPHGDGVELTGTASAREQTSGEAVSNSSAARPVQERFIRWRESPRGSGNALRFVATIGAVIVALVAVALVTVIAVRHFSSSTTSSRAAVRHSPASSPRRVIRPLPPPARPTAPVAPGLAPIPALAPPTAGEVTGTAASVASGACQPPAATCPIYVRVNLTPGHRLETVSWVLDVLDRCTGTVSQQPGGSVLLPSVYTFAFDTKPIVLPGAHPAAVIAVTTSPAPTASPPLGVGPPDQKC